MEIFHHLSSVHINCVTWVLYRPTLNEIIYNKIEHEIYIYIIHNGNILKTVKCYNEFNFRRLVLS